jgi:hypothetical protein
MSNTEDSCLVINDFCDLDISDVHSTKSRLLASGPLLGFSFTPTNGRINRSDTHHKVKILKSPVYILHKFPSEVLLKTNRKTLKKFCEGASGAVAKYQRATKIVLYWNKIWLLFSVLLVFTLL